MTPKIDNYEILSLLGEGEYGFVYPAIQHSTGQPVAIKFLKMFYEANEHRLNYQMARFERETIFNAELKHPNIVRLLDKGSPSEGTAYAVFEYVNGISLTLGVSIVRKSSYPEL